MKTTVDVNQDIDNLEHMRKAELEITRAMAYGVPIVHPDFVHSNHLMKLKKKYHQLLNEYCSLLNLIEDYFGGLLDE